MTPFDDFARARAPHLLRSAWLLCGDTHQAEDLVQETLAKVYVRWHRRVAGRIDNPAAYAQTTLVRTYLSSQRRRESSVQPRAELPELPLPDSTHRTDLRLGLEAALSSLSSTDRAVLVLRYLDDLSVDEVAARLDVSAGAVRNRSMRALERLRPLIDTSLLKELP